jgi:UDP-N-acetylglucosamine acyltransferase
MNVKEIMKLLPHRYPFLMVDKVIEISENKIIAQKNLTMNEEFFQGHFPGEPIMPGVLQVEALAQAAGIFGLVKNPEGRNQVTLFGGIDGVRFKRPVVPGDVLRLEVTIEKVRGPLIKCSGKTFVGDELATEVESLTLMIVPQKKPDNEIDPTAMVAESAKLGKGVKIGPYAIVSEDVEIGDNTQIDAHAVIGKSTVIGTDNHIHYGAIIGDKPQDTKYADEPTNVVIGNNNQIREYATIHKASGLGNKTIIGDNNIIMSMVHIAHNCKIGNEVTIVNMTQLAGHVEIGDQAVIGGQVGIPQFLRVGKLAMVGGYSRLFQDIPPYMLAEGNPADVHNINIVGLKRRGYSLDTINSLKKAYRLMYRADLNVSQAVDQIKGECLIEQDGVKILPPEVEYLLQFIKTSAKGITRKQTNVELLQNEASGLMETESFFERVKNLIKK